MSGTKKKSEFCLDSNIFHFCSSKKMADAAAVADDDANAAAGHGTNSLAHNTRLFAPSAS